MQPAEFITYYERALASQQWQNVEPLIHPSACVTFSNGAVFRGRDEIRPAYEHNFAMIQEERYRMHNVHWVLTAPEIAVFLFAFAWSGLIHGQPASGAGTGTAVLIRTGDRWLLLAEHLGPQAAS